jgi:hypothetical protein
MAMKKWIAVGAPLALVTGGIYVGSPYYAAYSLRNAALEADTDKLDASVDFPAVRESLKSQFSAAMITEMQNDPRMRDNPFAGLGAMMLPALIDRMVDAFITPDGIAALIRGQKPADVKGKIAPEPKPNPDIESRTDYVSLDRFRVRLHNNKLDEDGPSFLFERRGFASWKMIKVEMPANLLSKNE